MRGLIAVLMRELGGYFRTPVALVFIIVFLALSSVFTFYVGGFFERGQADLQSFFGFLPWLYLFLAPALAMRLWAEERRSGVVELLLTLPVPVWAAVVAKFLAAWLFAGVALALTFPLWITVNILGSPDNGAILASYAGAFLMAGGYLAIGSCLSAATRNQVIAFVLTAAICFLFTVAGLPVVLEAFAGWAPQFVVDAVASFSILTHFDAVSKGVLDARDVVYFASLIVAWLVATAITLDLKRAG